MTVKDWEVVARCEGGAFPRPRPCIPATAEYPSLDRGSEHRWLSVKWQGCGSPREQNL